MATTTDQDIMDFARKGYDSIQDDKRAARESDRLARVNERDYDGELRRRLKGKTIEVTGYTETVQRMTKDSREHFNYSRKLNNERLIVSSVYVTEESIGNNKSPLVYASRIDKDGKAIWGSEVTFRLLKVTLTIIS